MKRKHIAIITSIVAVLLTGCGTEKAEQKNQSVPNATPAKQVQTYQTDKVISKGKIVGKVKTWGNKGDKIVDVEERIVETVDVYGKPKTEKRYYNAETGGRIHYNPNEKDTTIKNEGQQVDAVKVK